MDRAPTVVHPTAVVDPSARLGAGVVIGAYAVVGAEVEVGDGTRIGPHCTIEGPTRIGRPMTSPRSGRGRVWRIC